MGGFNWSSVNGDEPVPVMTEVPSNSHDDRNEAATPEGYSTALLAVISIMIVIIASGCIGNLLVILAVLLNGKLQTVSNLFVVNLSICDLMFVTLVLPVNMYTYLTNDWHIQPTFCRFIGFFGYTLSGTTILTITLIAWNRYKLVVDVACYRSVFRPRNIAIMIVTMWLAPVICLQPAVWEKWGQFGYVPLLSSCNLSLNNSSQSFKIFLLILRAAIPCGLIIYFYWTIYSTTRASHHRLHHTASMTGTNGLHKHNVRREMKLTRMMIAIFLVFVISYFPCTISSLVDWSHLLSNRFHILCQTSVFLGSAINPLLYGLMNDQFRKAYYQILTCTLLFKQFKNLCSPDDQKPSDDINERSNHLGKQYSGTRKPYEKFSTQTMWREKYYPHCTDSSVISSQRKSRDITTTTKGSNIATISDRNLSTRCDITSASFTNYLTTNLHQTWKVNSLEESPVAKQSKI